MVNLTFRTMSIGPIKVSYSLAPIQVRVAMMVPEALMVVVVLGFHPALEYFPRR